ncbi:MAG: cold-shock protein [Parcubacteria group bacterium]|jgi:CspA family cold shock protein|nr:cold-shock protein [Parcubacteria group bacterium]
MTGTVKWFSDEKGFGFIIPEEGGKDLFVHGSQVDESSRPLKDSQRVSYRVGDGRKGPEAQEVRAA